MNINDLKVERSNKIQEMESIMNGANESKRSLDSDETQRWDDLNKEVENLNKEIERAEKQEELNKSIVERQLEEDNKEQMKESKRNLVDFINIENGSIGNFELQRHNMTTAEGAVDVEVGELSVIGKKSIWRQMGVKHMPNLSTSFKLPYLSPVVAGKKNEGESADQNGNTLGYIDFVPKRYTVWDKFSKELLSVGNESVIAGIVEELIEGAERKVTADVYTVADAAATANSGATSVSLADFDKLQADVDADGAYLMPRSIFFTAKGTPIDDGSGKFLANKISNEIGETSDGTPAFYSSLFSGTEVLYGAMNSIAVGEWGYDITFDTVTLAGSGEVKVTVAKLANVANRNPKGFVKTQLA